MGEESIGENPRDTGRERLYIPRKSLGTWQMGNCAGTVSTPKRPEERTSFHAARRGSTPDREGRAFTTKKKKRRRKLGENSKCEIA